MKNIIRHKTAPDLLKDMLKIMAAISLAASPVYAEADRFIPADDASLSFSDYARLTSIDSPFTPGQKMARGDRFIEIPTKGYEWDNPGMRCRFRTDAAEMRVHLYYSEKHCSTSGRNPVGIYLIDGRHEAAWQFTSICQKAVRPPESVIVPISAPSPGMHDYEIVLPYGDSVDVLGLSVNEKAHFETPAPRPKQRLVTIGDSITHGFNATVVSRSYAYLLAEKQKWQLVNMGIAGSSVSAKEGKLIASLEGDVVCVLSGVNAWQGGAPVEAYEENVQGFIRNLRAVQSSVPLVIITPLWVPPSWKPVKATIDLEKYRQTLREVVRTMNDENIHLVEGPDLIDHDEKYFDKVAVHPNDDGFAMMAERLANSLKDLQISRD
ncbi:MAG: GDSL-type esterase/lipase family protein [Phycisphaerae bacterium]|jgi:lysophospholipase L1-like esterase